MKSRLKIIPSDLQGEILLNLDHNDIIKACELEEFDNTCNNEYFWEKYAEKHHVNKILNTWKSSATLFPVLDFLDDFGPNYVGSVGVYPEVRNKVKESVLDDFTDKETKERYDYLKSKSYTSKYNRDNEEYIFYKSFDKYLGDRNLIVPYSKVILISDNPIVTKDNWTTKLTNNMVHEGFKYLIQPPLSSKPYIILEIDRVIIDSKIKGSSLIAEDILFASRAFMKNYTGNIIEIKLVKEESDVLVLKVSTNNLSIK